MDNLLAARSTMAITLGFHIIFACIGIAMPFLMVISHWLWIRKKNKIYLDLTKAWSKGVAIFFAIGAVSGTALSFELGLLWPGFMKYAGPIIGMPFSWEGTAFFIEAICIGLFLYGWDKLNPYVHWASGLIVGVSGMLSGIFVVTANAWMNAPAGFDLPAGQAGWINGQAYNIRPFEAMFNPAWVSETLHMTLAAFEATAFAVAGIHAILLLRKHNYEIHKKAIIIALSFGSIFAVVQPISGDHSAKDVAKRQPEKLAAMEGLFHTEKSAGLTIGGIPDVQKEETHFGIKVPGLLSFLAYGDFNAEVKGLNEFPRENWPPPVPVHIAFQLMVACGFFLAAVGVVFWLLRWKWKDYLFDRRFLYLAAISTPLGFLAVEAGWTVTEVGRQPWIIYNIMRTADSVTPVPGQIYHLAVFIIIYLILGIVAVWLMKRQIKALNESQKAAGV